MADTAEQNAISSQHPITDVSFPVTGTCLLACGAVYVLFGFWSVKSLVYANKVFEPRWLLLPLALGIIGMVLTAAATFPIAIAIGLVYSTSDTIIAEKDLVLFVTPMSLSVLFFAFGTLKLQYSA